MRMLRAGEKREGGNGRVQKERAGRIPIMEIKTKLEYAGCD